MKKLDLKRVPKNLKPDPIFAGLPDSLKTMKSFRRIEKELFNIVQTDHEHKTIKAYVKCIECQTKREQRQAYIKSEGFTDIGQYLAWKKVMNIIHNKKSFELK